MTRVSSRTKFFWFVLIISLVPVISVSGSNALNSPGNDSCVRNLGATALGTDALSEGLSRGVSLGRTGDYYAQGATPEADHAGPSSSSSSGAESASSQVEHAGSRVQQSRIDVNPARDVARISYPGAVLPAGEVAVEPKPKSILMVKPQKFEREGIYIWRDAQGVWNVRRVGEEESTFSGTVTAATSISGIASGTGALPASGDKMATVEQSGIPDENALPIQFTAKGDYVDFDILLDGKRDPGQVFLGWRGINPAAIPFRIENRTAVGPNVTEEATASASEAPSIEQHSSKPGTVTGGKSAGSNGGGIGGGRGERRPRE